MMKILTLIFSFTTVVLFGQHSNYQWADELCEYQSLYDTSLFSETQIKNCYSLVMLDYYSIYHTPSVFKPEDIKLLKMDTLDNEYINKSKKLQTLELPKTKNWEDIRNKKLNELNQVYTLSRIVYQVYLDSFPKALKNYRKSDTCLTRHSDALINGGKNLLDDWFLVTAQQAAQNGFPEKIWEAYYTQLQSKNKFLYAKIEVTSFGWWNCAINSIVFFDNFIGIEEFKKLFIATTIIDCEEP